MTENQTVLRHVPWVRRIAYKYRNWGVPIDDLLQEGLIGFVTALRKWRPDLGACSACKTPRCKRPPGQSARPGNGRSKSKRTLS